MAHDHHDDVDCDSASSEIPSLALRIGSVFAILFASGLGVALPLIANKMGVAVIDSPVLRCGTLFGAGVILATALVHMLAPALENLENECLDEKWRAYPIPMAVCLGTMLAAHLLQLTIRRALKKKHNGGYSNLDAPHVGDGPHHGECHDLAEEIVMREQKASTILLEIGVASHSVIIGVVLGVAREEFIALAIALCVHQFCEGLALSCVVLQAKFRARDLLLLALLYGLATPSGASVGVAVSASLDADRNAHFLIITAFLDSVAAGILLYDGLVNILVPQFAAVADASTGKLALYTTSVWLGAGVMALIGMWA